MTETTRGEWAVRPRRGAVGRGVPDGSAGFDVYSPEDGFLIATVNARPLLRETRANAALIAKAPQLARSVRTLLEWVETVRGKLSDVPSFEVEQLAVKEAEGAR